MICAEGFGTKSIGPLPAHLAEGSNPSREIMGCLVVTVYIDIRVLGPAQRDRRLIALRRAEVSVPLPTSFFNTIAPFFTQIMFSFGSSS